MQNKKILCLRGKAVLCAISVRYECLLRLSMYKSSHFYIFPLRIALFVVNRNEIGKYL